MRQCIDANFIDPDAGPTVSTIFNYFLVLVGLCQWTDASSQLKWHPYLTAHHDDLASVVEVEVRSLFSHAVSAAVVYLITIWSQEAPGKAGPPSVFSLVYSLIRILRLEGINKELITSVKS